MEKFEYNQIKRPWLDPYAYREAKLFPEVSAGVFFFEPEVQVSLVYRNMEATQKGYGIQQTYKRQSFTLEAFKYLFDFYGFNPYIGLNISSDHYSIHETDEEVETISDSEHRVTPGITFGWDIVPVKRERFTLRTNLRWNFHDSNLFGNTNYKMSGSQLEFNLIKFVLYF